MKNHFFIYIVAVLFYGCTSNSNLSSSFGERKYNKGYFLNLPASAPRPDIAVTKQTTTGNKRETERTVAPVGTPIITTYLTTTQKLKKDTRGEKTASQIKSITIVHSLLENTAPTYSKGSALEQIKNGRLLIIMGLILAVAFLFLVTGPGLVYIFIVPALILALGIIIYTKGKANYKKAPADEPIPTKSPVNTTAPKDDSYELERKPKETEGIILFIGGIVLFASGYFLSIEMSALVIGGDFLGILLIIPVILLLVMGLILFITGIIHMIKYAKHKNP